MNMAAALLLQEYPAVSLYLKASQKSNHLLRQIFFPLEAQHLPYSCKDSDATIIFTRSAGASSNIFLPSITNACSRFLSWIFSVNLKYIFAADS